MNQPIIEIENVYKTYGSNRWFKRNEPEYAVDGVSLAIHRGETFGIVGESGSGKTTLAHMILGIIKPGNGRIKVLEHELTDPKVNLSDMSNKIQFVFQDPHGSLNQIGRASCRERV